LDGASDGDGKPSNRRQPPPHVGADGNVDADGNGNGNELEFPARQRLGDDLDAERDDTRRNERWLLLHRPRNVLSLGPEPLHLPASQWLLCVP